VVAIDYAGQTLIPFEDRSYRWVSVKRFTCDCGASDEEILAGLIGHWRYRDNFLSADSHEHDTRTVHGPYRVAEINPSSFERIGPYAATTVVGEFCGLYDSRPRPEVQERIQAEVLSPLQRSVCYRLRELLHAVHEYAFVLMEFRELVAIDRSASAVLSIVMAID
jgi:hypothetical protein